MRGFSILIGVSALALIATLGLDRLQLEPHETGRTAVTFVSMWAPGEPMQQAYAQLFSQFEDQHPQYRVRPRWEGRWVLPAIRPRLLTNSDVPDIINIDRMNLPVLVEGGFLRTLDDVLESRAHPDDRGRAWAEALEPGLLELGYFSGGRGEAPYEEGTYLLPAGIWLHLIFYNRVHYEGLRLEVPRTWSELMDNCRELEADGLVPFTSDGVGYERFLPEVLLPHAVGPETLLGSVRGTGPRFDHDPRYRSVFSAIRSLHRPGWYRRGWQGSIWPAAQLAWLQGEATHIVNGSWLLREARPNEFDPQVIRPGAFPVPVLDDLDEDHRRKRYVFGEIPGYALFRAAENPEGAIALLSFLCRRDSATQISRLAHEIPAVKGASVPTYLEEIRHLQEEAGELLGEDLRESAPLWRRFVFLPLFENFLLEGDHLSVEGFLIELQRRTDEHLERSRQESRPR